MSISIISVQTDLQLIAELPRRQQATHLHLAGDIANKETAAMTVIDFFQRAAAYYLHWGNHEMADLSESLIETYPDPAFLNFQTSRFIGKNTLVGVHGWYD